MLKVAETVTEKVTEKMTKLVKLWRSVLIVVFTIISLPLRADSVVVSLTDIDAKPVQGAVAYALARFSIDYPSNVTDNAQMVQQNKQFSPDILVVQKASQVFFPNLDDIQHHVYSFSPAHPFEKKLYKGRDTQAELFDKEGTVELGCNVHDWMLGYIKVVDTPFFGVTDESGQLTLSDLPEGDYRLIIWHPRILNAFQGVQQDIKVKDVTQFPYQLSDEMDTGFEGYDAFEQEEDYQ